MTIRSPIANISLVPNKLLRDLCTLGIGGPAAYYCVITTIAEMQELVRHCYQEKIRYHILGRGSNSLFDDRGYDGLVIHNKIDFCSHTSEGTWHVGAGYNFSLLGVQTARDEWSGLEFASGIPASVGGAVYMNAGANGAETCQSLVSVDYVDETGELKTLAKENLNFGYRHSPFQGWRGAIVGATFRLIKVPTARQRQLEIIDYRKKTQPYSEKSAGCIFRNPASGHAGALIEQSQLKGFKMGEAQVSEKHANFLINTGSATAHDFLQLMVTIKEQVKTKTGITLESEVRCVPYREEKA